MKQQIGFREFSLNNANQAQWVIIAIFAGMAIGELVAGIKKDML